MAVDDVRLFKALGDSTRLNIVGHLLTNESCPCDLQLLNDKDRTTVSRHLKTLTEAGIIIGTREGRNIVYRIKDDAVRERLLRMGVTAEGSCECEAAEGGHNIKDAVRSAYGKMAREGGSCGGCCGDEDCDPATVSASLGYSEEDLLISSGSNMGLGCGNPIALAGIEGGETVLDLGSGAGMDSFLASKRVGPRGKVIGVDITEEMIDKARGNARDTGIDNVEFRLGDIEQLPVDTGSMDVVISNCVINLAQNKQRVFEEAFRALRGGGRLCISDMVLTGDLSEEQRNDEELLTGCVAGALPIETYLHMLQGAGFRVEHRSEDRGIADRQYRGLPVSSLKVMALKE